MGHYKLEGGSIAHFKVFTEILDLAVWNMLAITEFGRNPHYTFHYSKEFICTLNKKTTGFLAMEKGVTAG